MANVTARFVVKDIQDEGLINRITLRAKSQAEGANTENPILFPDASVPEELIHIRMIASAVTGIFVKGSDVLVNFNGPA
jgi:hypothetical protein